MYYEIQPSARKTTTSEYNTQQAWTSVSSDHDAVQRSELVTYPMFGSKENTSGTAQCLLT